MLIIKLKSSLPLVLNIHFSYYKHACNTHVSELQKVTSETKKQPSTRFKHTFFVL